MKMQVKSNWSPELYAQIEPHEDDENFSVIVAKSFVRQLNPNEYVSVLDDKNTAYHPITHSENYILVKTKKGTGWITEDALQ